MGEWSALDELKQLLALTEQCAAHARAAKQQVQRFSEHYKVNAEQFRKQAALSYFPEIRERLLRIAASNERLWNIAKGIPITAEAKDEASQPEPLSKPPQDATIRRAEDSVSQARRHVAEGKARIERQEALIARLYYSGKHISLAGQADVILTTLKQTHQLACDHLELELKKHPSLNRVE
jgi:hypothetical protein